MNVVKLVFDYPSDKRDDFKLFCPFCGAPVLENEEVKPCPHVAFWYYIPTGGGIILEVREGLLERANRRPGKRKLYRAIEDGAVFELEEMGMACGPVSTTLTVGFSRKPYNKDFLKFSDV